MHMIAYQIKKKERNMMLEVLILKVMEDLIWVQAFQVVFHQEEPLECQAIWVVVLIQTIFSKYFSNKTEVLEVLADLEEWEEKVKLDLD
jgi:hypothetical protein